NGSTVWVEETNLRTFDNYTWLGFDRARLKVSSRRSAVNPFANISASVQPSWQERASSSPRGADGKAGERRVGEREHAQSLARARRLGTINCGCGFLIARAPIARKTRSQIFSSLLTSRSRDPPPL